METLEAVDAVSARDRELIAARWKGKRPMPDAPDKVAALTDVIVALQQAQIRSALIGGVAVAVHSGTPRATIDTDLAVHSSVERGRVIAVLQKSGFQLTGEFAHSINFRHASGEPVQLLLDPAFDAMIERAEHFLTNGIQIPIVSKSDLIRTKEMAAADPAQRRSKALRDQADIELLKGDVPDPDEGW